MKEILLKIFDSEIMYYVVIPIVIVLLGWVKNERDLKEKNKELGYWMLKCRKIPTFPDIIVTTLIISKKPGNTGISRDIRTEFTTDLLLSD